MTAHTFPYPPGDVTDDEGRSITIRTAADDVETLISMYRAFDSADRAQGIPPADPERIRDWLVPLLDAGVDVIAQHDDQIIGHATLVPDETGDEHELAIFVLSAYRGAGIGTTLLRYALGAGQQAGVERVWLSVERWNSAAIAIYEKVGFKRQTTDRFELQMTLALANGTSAPA